jgi:ribosome maturation factor RimP
LLKNSRQYVLSVGQHVEVVLVDPHPDLTGDRHRTTGKLRAADEQGIELELENGQVLRVEFGQIRRGKIVFGIKKNKKR